MTYPAWTLPHGTGPDALGFLPYFLSEANPAPAREQLHKAYAHGGGWHDFEGFTLVRPADNPEPLTWQLQYPGDPAYSALAFTRLRDETIVLFRYSWVAIVQPDGSFNVARMD
jgi:hypothetical protein